MLTIQYHVNLTYITLQGWGNMFEYWWVNYTQNVHTEGPWVIVICYVTLQ